MRREQLDRRRTALYAASSYRPRAMPDWLETVITASPLGSTGKSPRRAGKQAHLAGLVAGIPDPLRWPVAVEKTRHDGRARRGRQHRAPSARARDALHLVGEDGAGIEDHVIVGRYGR